MTVPILHEDEAERLDLPGRQLRWLVSDKPHTIAAQYCSACVIRVPPGEKVRPAHSHPNGEEVIFVISGSGRVVSQDVSKDYGNTAWELMIPKGGLDSTPALYENTLYIGGGDGNVYAVSAANREPQWSLKDSVFKTQGPIHADLAVDADGVYVACTDSRLYVLARATGRLKWQFYASAALTQTPVVTKTVVYLPIPGQGVAAIPNGDGAFNLRDFSCDNRVSPNPVYLISTGTTR